MDVKKSEETPQLKMADSTQSDKWVIFCGRRISRDTRAGYYLSIIASIFCIGGIIMGLIPFGSGSPVIHELIFSNMAYLGVSAFVFGAMFIYAGAQEEEFNKASSKPEEVKNPVSKEKVIEKSQSKEEDLKKDQDLDYKHFSWNRAQSDPEYSKKYYDEKFKKEITTQTLSDRITTFYYQAKASIFYKSKKPKKSA